MSKRKILVLALSLCMVAILAVGGSLAYLTDTDNKENTFTVGNVNIKIIEKQRGENGLEDFEQNKKLSPIVGSAQGAKDKYGLPTAGNYVDKIVTVALDGASDDAYVRLYYAIPTVLDNVGDASQNVVHLNIGNKYDATGSKTEGTANTQIADYANMGKEVYVGTATIDNIGYNVYYQTYNKILSKSTTGADETGTAFLTGLYLDDGVDYDGTNYTINGKTINYDFSKGVKIPVYAIGAQAAGFEAEKDVAGTVTKTAADVALDAAFGANYNPWN